MIGPIVTLTSAEWAFANQAAALRQVSNEAAGRRDAHGASSDLGLEGHMQGAAAECALAKYLGIFWSGALGELRAKDVGLYQVRSTQLLDGRLIMHPTDCDDDVFVLAIGKAPTFRLRGWIRARQGKRQHYWSDPSRKGRWAFFVPQDVLQEMPPRRERGASIKQAEEINA